MVDFRSIEGEGNFYLLRHGESQGNRDRVIQGRFPSALTAEGRNQARGAGSWFAARGLDLVLCSPLARALETGQIIAQAAGGVPLEGVEELTEIDTGLFTNMTWDDARRKHPEEWRMFAQHGWGAVPGAESTESLAARAEEVWGLLFARLRAGKRRILAVTHSGFLQWLFRVTFGHREWMPLVATPENCCVSHLEVRNTPLGNGARAQYANWVMVNSPMPAG